MSQKKIINDPIYGLISFKFDFLYQLIDHPIFQRLRRISQMGLSNYVYPGATHTRWGHAIGALHLMSTAIDTLRVKGVQISEEEYLSVSIAILLHDIGHGPFSHALEHIIIEEHHETISLKIMEMLNEEYDGALDLAISIYKGEYRRPFLSQLVSSQLDMDRMDYLTRDSYYSGVAEGVIGYKRIISMLNVHDDHLVVEEKGIFSVEKFIIARHFMYWQVYLHKTSLATEQMLKLFVRRVKKLVRDEDYQIENKDLQQLFSKSSINGSKFADKLFSFLKLDDIDIFTLLKQSASSTDQLLSFLSQSLLNRRLFGIILQNKPIEGDLIDRFRQNVKMILSEVDEELIEELLIMGKETTQIYNNERDWIKIMNKNDEIKDISHYLYRLVKLDEITKYYLCYPKFNI